MKKYSACIARGAVAAFVAFGLGYACAASPALADSSYVLHPGDQVAITVFDEPSISETATLLPDGSIAYPLIGRVKLGGETVAAATQQITTKLRRFVRDPLVTVAVTQVANYDVLVLGDVKTPGKFSLPSTARLADAIAAAGGVADSNGAYPDARVSVNNGTPVTVSLQGLLRQGNVADNIPLGSQAVVYVPGPTPLQVQVIGNVDKPGTIDVHVGDRLAMAVALAGTSANSKADLSHIRVTETSPDGATTVREYNLYSALKDGDLAADPLLTKNDVIYVPEAHQGDRLSSTLQGALLLLSRLVIPL